MIKEAKMEEWRNMSANLVKIGNSLSVRIPASTIKELSLKENDILALKVRKFNIDETAPEAIKQQFGDYALQQAQHYVGGRPLLAAFNNAYNAKNYDLAREIATIIKSQPQESLYYPFREIVDNALLKLPQQIVPQVVTQKIGWGPIEGFESVDKDIFSVPITSWGQGTRANFENLMGFAPGKSIKLTIGEIQNMVDNLRQNFLPKGIP